MIEAEDDQTSDEPIDEGETADLDQELIAVGTKTVEENWQRPAKT